MILQCIQISYAHPIIECIDRNGSGFISIREANTFVNERPPGWRCVRSLTLFLLPSPVAAQSDIIISANHSVSQIGSPTGR